MVAGVSKALATIVSFMACGSAAAQAPIAAGNLDSAAVENIRPADRRGDRHISEVTVRASRPLSKIGLQETRLDSAALRENIALSMADVIGSNSSVFVKTSGRATLSTVAIRGASAAHTATTWNGISINSPSLGMTDFSMIPAYFIDRASLLYGASSLVEGAGGLGGAVALSTSAADIVDGWDVRYVQGVGSFKTFDEFLKIGYGGDKWRLSTRAVYSSSANDFKFVNRDKKLNIYDDNHQIISQYHPIERNSNGAYHDFHLLQEVYFSPGRADQIGLNAWITRSRREIPLTTVDYVENRRYDNRQDETSVRAVADWRHMAAAWRSEVKVGYALTKLDYLYAFEVADGVVNRLTDSRTTTNSLFLNFKADYSPLDNIFLTAAANLAAHDVSSHNYAALNGALGYDKRRFEASAVATVRYQLLSRLGLSAIVREDVYGSAGSAFTPSFFADYQLWAPANLAIKASIARNHRFPSLNDLYFMPGGNPDLRPEKGFTYDASVSASTGSDSDFSVSGSIGWFDSKIDDWILWLPTNKGFFTPRNLKNVRSQGLEAAVTASKSFAGGWTAALNGSLAWTRSRNVGPAVSDADKSVGRQLPYVPKLTANARFDIGWRGWELCYRWAHYSKRYTMSSNENSLSGSLPSYFMSDVSLSKGFSPRWADFNVKISVNNLFDADYQTILSHPMPGRNFEVFVSISPRL